MEEAKYIIGYKNNFTGSYYDVYVQEMNCYKYVYRDKVDAKDIDETLEKLKEMYPSNHVCFFKIY